MTHQMNNVGEQGSAKRLNPKVLSGGDPRGDEGKDALLRGDDNDCVENFNIINSMLRTNADGLSMPHMFLENEQVRSNHAQNATQGMTLYNASFNRKEIEEQNITKTALNRKSFDYALSSRPFPQKLVAIVKPIPRESVASDPDETLLKQRYSSLSDSDEMNENLQQCKDCDVLSHESIQSTRICKCSEQVCEDIEHTEEEIKTTENVVEPRFAQNTCQVQDVSLRNRCVETIRSDTEEEFENKDTTGNRQWTDPKSRDRASVSMSNEPKVTYVKDSFKEKFPLEEKIGKTVKNDEKSSKIYGIERSSNDPNLNIINCQTPVRKYQSIILNNYRNNKHKKMKFSRNGKHMFEKTAFACWVGKRLPFNEGLVSKTSGACCILCTVNITINKTIPVSPSFRYQLDPIHAIFQDGLYLESVKTLFSHWHSVPFTELFLAPVRRLILSESLESEFRRRVTFQNTENQDIVDRLVRNGYVYIERENEIICHLCGGRWRQGDIPERSHHPGCQYLDERSPGIHSVSTATALNNGTTVEIGGQFFGHIFTENMTLEVFPNDPRVAYRARNRQDSQGNCGIYERVSQNASCRILDDGGSCVESPSVPRMTQTESFSETPQVEILSFSACQTVDDQLQILVSYFRRQRDPLGPRGGRPIIVLRPLANNGRRRHRRHITVLLPRTPVQESESLDDAAVNYCCTYSHDSSNIQIGNNLDDPSSCSRTESLQPLNRAAENILEHVERSYGELRHIQHLNYLTTAGRNVLETEEGDQKIDKRKCIQSVGRYGDENNGSQERRGGDLQHIQRLNYLTTASRKVIQAEHGHQKMAKRELMNSTGRIGHTDTGRYGDANNFSQKRRGRDLHHIQRFNYLTTAGRKVPHAEHRGQKRDKRELTKSTGWISHTDPGRYGDQNIVSQDRRGGDLQHIQRLNYLTTDGRKVTQAEHGYKERGKADLVTSKGRIGHTEPGRYAYGGQKRQ